MDYSRRWQKIGDLGKGGQGVVYRVLDTSQFNVDGHLLPAIKNSIRYLAVTDYGVSKDHFEAFRKAVVALVQMEDPSHHGALKVLHQPEESRDADRAKARIKTEIEAMRKIAHPNLLMILDADPDSEWFVSHYYLKGTLAKNESSFVGDFEGALRSFRPLVEGVSELHKRKVVHRDIKPQNVFLDTADNLVLGDFGLVFFTDERHTRISDTWENVGSRDWMPGWAMGMRVEDIKPSFDVYCLGKLLWHMVSGLPMLRLWYYDEPEFNVEARFPRGRAIQWANPLFNRCIVEHEKDCLPDASTLLAEVDQVLSLIDNNAHRLDPNVKRRCKVCGVGSYQLIGDRSLNETTRFGLQPVGDRTLKIFT